MRLRSQEGFTLLEVLVAVLVLSIGLIGLAGLQVSGIKVGRDAYFESQAEILTSSISDRMRANLDGVTAGNYNAGASSVTAACRTSSGCTAAQLAADDVALWRAAVAARLPNGEAMVCVDSSPEDGTGVATAACDNSGNLYAIKIWWEDDQNPATNPALKVVTFQP